MYMSFLNSDFNLYKPEESDVLTWFECFWACLFVIYLVAVVLGIVLCWRNKTLSVSEKIGWTLLFIVLHVFALLAYLIVCSYAKQRGGNA